MQEAQKKLEQMISLMGFKEFSINYFDDMHRFSVIISDAPFLRNTNLLTQFITDINFIFKMLLKQDDLEIAFIDVNNYKKEREDIIIKLARAAAKKSATMKQEVELPCMNSFERRIVHKELSMHPNVETRSEGEGKDRHIIISPIAEG